MRKVCIVVCLLLLTVQLGAQGRRTGNIFGQIVDEEGILLPGITVTLTGSNTAPMATVTSEEGKFRFISLYPGKDYKIKSEIAGFKTRIDEGIIIAVGVNTELKLVMEIGGIEQAITVTAERPVIDKKSTLVSRTVDYNELQSIPLARDPFVILQTTASIVMDRENVGGNESGSQSKAASKGAQVYDSFLRLDGVIVGGAQGDSLVYWDFGIFEEMQVITGGGNVESQTGGITLNMVTRRGTNKLSVGGRYYLTDEKFQNKISEEELADFGVAGYNKIVQIKDFGFNLGGPIWKDKAWFWASYGTNEISLTNLFNVAETTYLPSYTFKLNVQPFANNRFEALLFANKKQKFGRESSAQYPPGFWQDAKYHFGTPILKLQDEHMFGDNLYVSAKFGHVFHGWFMISMEDTELKEMMWTDIENDLRERTTRFYFSDMPTTDYNLQVKYYLDSFLGVAHDFKIGVEYLDREAPGSRGPSPGNAYVDWNFHTRTVDYDGDGDRDIVKDEFGVDIKRFWVQRGDFSSHGINRWVGYLNDNMSFGRWNLSLGLRYDWQHTAYLGGTLRAVYTEDVDVSPQQNFFEVWEKYSTAEAREKIDALLPGITLEPVDPDYSWVTLTPRFGISWDVTGDGKTMAKISGVLYLDNNLPVS